MKTAQPSGKQRIGRTWLAIALGVGLAIGVQAQEQAIPAPPSREPGPALAKAAESRPSGPVEGIKVHGRWTIDIKNPDGSLASHHEFENALADSLAAFQLAEVLARQKTPGEWGVGLYQGSVAGRRPPCPLANRMTCMIAEVGSANPEAQFKTLTVSALTTGPNASKLALSGSATAEADGDIGVVFTTLGFCPGSTAPTSCGAYSNALFTVREMSPPLLVLANQIVQVTVVISFS